MHGARIQDVYQHLATGKKYRSLKAAKAAGYQPEAGIVSVALQSPTVEFVAWEAQGKADVSETVPVIEPEPVAWSWVALLVVGGGRL